MFLGILGGLLAMIGWGTGDFIAASTSKEIGFYKTTFWSQLVSLILYLLALLFFFNLKSVSIMAIGLIILTGFLSTIAFLSFYKGLEIGAPAIISPVSSSWSIVTVVLSIIFLGQKLTLLQGFAVFLVIVGGILTSFKWIDLKKVNFKNPAKGLTFALLSALCSGIFFIFLDILKQELGWFLPLVLIRLAAVIFLTIYLLIFRKDSSLPKDKKINYWLILIGGFEFFAMMSYGFGINFQNTALVNPIAAAFPMVTVILSRLFLKEKLEINQFIGIGAVISALIIISI